MSDRDAQIARMLQTPCPECGGDKPLSEHDCREVAVGSEIIADAIKQATQSFRGLSGSTRRASDAVDSLSFAAGIPVRRSKLIPEGELYVVRDPLSGQESIFTNGTPRVFVDGEEIAGITDIQIS